MPKDKWLAVKRSQPAKDPYLPSPGLDPANYCRKLREMVQQGVFDFYTANAMWQNYRKSLQMLGLRDPGPCALGPEGPTQPVWDPGGGDEGGLLSLSRPDAAYGVKEIAATLDPLNWFPRQQPQIDLGFDASAAGGGVDPGGPSGTHFPPSSGGFDPSRGAAAPAVYPPDLGPAARMPMPEAVPPYALPQAEVIMQGPDGTYIPVPYMPRPVPQPAVASPSPYEGVPVTGSFGIKDS